MLDQLTDIAEVLADKEGQAPRSKMSTAQMHFIFYDSETTGTDTTFDQIVQLAAILTDANLNVLDRFETRCHLPSSPCGCLAEFSGRRF